MVTDANNCPVSSNFSIDTVYVLHISALSTNVSCFGAADGTATVTALNGTSSFTYSWSPSNQVLPNATGLSPASYSVVVTDSKNCTASATTTIIEPTEIVLLFNHTNPLCTGIANGTADVTATGGSGAYTYDWAYLAGASDGNSLNGIPAGVYDVTVTDASSCSVRKCNA